MDPVAYKAKLDALPEEARAALLRPGRIEAMETDQKPWTWEQWLDAGLAGPWSVQEVDRGDWEMGTVFEVSGPLMADGKLRDVTVRCEAREDAVALAAAQNGVMNALAAARRERLQDAEFASARVGEVRARADDETADLSPESRRRVQALGWPTSDAVEHKSGVIGFVPWKCPHCGYRAQLPLKAAAFCRGCKKTSPMEAPEG